MIFLLIILILLVVSDAIGDGLRVIEKQKWHHRAEVMVIALWFALLTVSINIRLFYIDILWMVLFYTSVRIILFNRIINKVMGKSWDYVGKSDPIWDVLPWKWRNRIGLLAYLGVIISGVMLIS